MLVYRSVHFPGQNTFHPPHEPLGRSCGLLMTREGKTCCCWFGWPGLHFRLNGIVWMNTPLENEHCSKKGKFISSAKTSIFNLKSRLILPLKCYLGSTPDTGCQSPPGLWQWHIFRQRVFSPWHPGSGKAIQLGKNSEPKTAVTS